LLLEDCHFTGKKAKGWTGRNALKRFVLDLVRRAFEREPQKREMARGEYGDVHRAVVQTFMSKKVMKEKEAIELVRSFSRCAPCGGLPSTRSLPRTAARDHDAMQRATAP